MAGILLPVFASVSSFSPFLLSTTVPALLEVCEYDCREKSVPHDENEWDNRNDIRSTSLLSFWWNFFWMGFHVSSASSTSLGVGRQKTSTNGRMREKLQNGRWKRREKTINLCLFLAFVALVAPSFHFAFALSCVFVLACSREKQFSWWWFDVRFCTPARIHSFLQWITISRSKLFGSMPCNVRLNWCATFVVCSRNAKERHQNTFALSEKSDDKAKLWCKGITQFVDSK